MNRSQNETPLILVTNDDGITAPGIHALIETMNEIGEVYVVAPNKAQSGMSHAFTIDKPVFCYPTQLNGKSHKEWSCSGTPVDCVKIALDQFLPRPPDICVSGINHGGNYSVNIFYSGTMSAAIEAGIEGIPSIGFSLLDSSYDADFAASKYFAKKIVKQALSNELPENVILNVNIPKGSLNKIKGIKICHQAKAKWSEPYEKRISPTGNDYYWLCCGKFQNFDLSNQADKNCLNNHFVSVVPIQFDLTKYNYLQTLNSWNFDD